MARFFSFVNRLIRLVRGPVRKTFAPHFLYASWTSNIVSVVYPTRYESTLSAEISATAAKIASHPVIIAQDSNDEASAWSPDIAGNSRASSGSESPHFCRSTSNSRCIALKAQTGRNPPWNPPQYSTAQVCLFRKRAGDQLDARGSHPFGTKGGTQQRSRMEFTDLGRGTALLDVRTSTVHGSCWLELDVSPCRCWVLKRLVRQK